jgi:hypothetical protein
MLNDARAGDFRAPPAGHHYQSPVDCHIDRKRQFRGADLYLCQIAISGLPSAHLREWGAWVNGSLHTHATDPRAIPAATGGGA